MAAAGEGNIGKLDHTVSALLATLLWTTVTAFPQTLAWIHARDKLMKRPCMAFLAACMPAIQSPAAHLTTTSFRRDYREVIWLPNSHHVVGMPFALQMQLRSETFFGVEYSEYLFPHLHSQSSPHVAEDIHAISGAARNLLEYSHSLSNELEYYLRITLIRLNVLRKPIFP